MSSSKKVNPSKEKGLKKIVKPRSGSTNIIHAQNEEIKKGKIATGDDKDA